MTDYIYAAEEQLDRTNVGHPAVSNEFYFRKSSLLILMSFANSAEMLVKSLDTITKGVTKLWSSALDLMPTR